ncbi:Predicted flavoproteins [Butyrivibrio fibrisolvens 16/4]|nr:Predicted flavoproteins [Butyrivibrio fibrisolvens 16/4]
MANVIVVGGGAAGMMAAYAAGMCGHAVTLLEKTKIRKENLYYRKG